MQVLGRRPESEGVDGHIAASKPELQETAAKQGGELAVALSQVEDDSRRLVLLRVRHQKVQQEALAAAGGTEDDGMAHVVDVEVEVERRLLTGFKDAQRLVPQLRTRRVSAVQSEQETQVGAICFEQRQSADVVRAV